MSCPEHGNKTPTFSRHRQHSGPNGPVTGPRQDLAFTLARLPSYSCIMKPAKHVAESQSDILDPARAAAFQVALGWAADIVHGTPLPPFFHQLYFWSPLTPDSLGRDGHPSVGTDNLIPDLGLPRRMWAGGRLEFNTHLIAGMSAEKTSVVEQVTHKTGQTGPLAFVTLRHDIRQKGELCVSEWQDLVYRGDWDANAPRPTPLKARQDESEASEVVFSTTLLFRYSALTFNGHRIHYDQDYAQDIEGYDGLVVHGPLLAQLLMLMAQDLIGPLGKFTFRAASPLVHSETGYLCRNQGDLWVRGPDGRLIMGATALAK